MGRKTRILKKDDDVQCVTCHKKIMLSNASRHGRTHGITDKKRPSNFTERCVRLTMKGRRRDIDFDSWDDPDPPRPNDSVTDTDAVTGPMEVDSCGEDDPAQQWRRRHPSPPPPWVQAQFPYLTTLTLTPTLTTPTPVVNSRRPAGRTVRQS